MKPLTDHYLQVEILKKLARSPDAVRFTDLKQDGIENSLFMYHVNKLIARGLVTKVESKGFTLTQAGAQWINFLGSGGLHPQMTPRLLVQLLVQNVHGEYLLSQRSGVQKDLLNEYLLPGGLYKYGFTAEQNVQRVAEHLGLQLGSSVLEFSTLAETITEKDETTYHSLACIYRLSAVESGTLPDSKDDDYTFSWHAIEDICAAKGIGEPDGFLVTFFQKLSAGTLQTRETFVTKF